MGFSAGPFVMALLISSIGGVKHWYESLTTNFGDTRPRTVENSTSCTSLRPLTVIFQVIEFQVIKFQVIQFQVIRQAVKPAERRFLVNLNRLSSVRRRYIERIFRLLFTALGFVCLSAPAVSAFAQGQHEPQTLRIAVYDVPPYGYVDNDGSISGVSVDLWRRVAEQMEWPFRLIPISDMETIISGLEQGRFDAAIGAVTITPERAARVDFSYPAHRSGVAIALRKETGPISALVFLWCSRR
jgi:Bacterial extracellular solute-binding proteins, family 3